MVLLDAERKVKRRCCGLGSKVQTAVLPDGGLTTEFQNWRIAFGQNDVISNKFKVLQGITKDSILADRSGGYVHSRLQDLVAPKHLFGRGYYSLEYRLPAAPFTICVEADNVDQLSRAYDQFATLPKKQRKRLVLKLIPRHPGEEAPIFDERPPKTVKSKRLDTRAAMTRYLVDLYTNDKLPLAKLDACMKLGMSELRSEIYTILPDHEKRDHDYLEYGGQTAKVKRKSLEQRYMHDEINLEEYADLKDPERKARRDRERHDYPLPGPIHKCVICQQPGSTNIKCMECSNRACRNCIISKFVDRLEERAFVNFHHIYCLKLGEPTNNCAATCESKRIVQPLPQGQGAARRIR